VVALTDAGLAQLEATFPGHLASVRHHVFDALTGVDLDSFTDTLSRIAPDEPLAHLANVEIPSRQRAAGEPGGARRPRSTGKLRSIIGIIAECQDRQAQYLANQQVDDLEQHLASYQHHITAAGESAGQPLIEYSSGTGLRPWPQGRRTSVLMTPVKFVKGVPEIYGRYMIAVSVS